MALNWALGLAPANCHTLGPVALMSSALYLLYHSRTSSCRHMLLSAELYGFRNPDLSGGLQPASARCRHPQQSKLGKCPACRLPYNVSVSRRTVTQKYTHLDLLHPRSKLLQSLVTGAQLLPLLKLLLQLFDSLMLVVSVKAQLRNLHGARQPWGATTGEGDTQSPVSAPST